MVCRVWREPSARHSTATNSSGPPAGRRQVQRGTLAGFGGVAFDPVVAAEVAPSGVEAEIGPEPRRVLVSACPATLLHREVSQPHGGVRGPQAVESRQATVSTERRSRMAMDTTPLQIYVDHTAEQSTRPRYQVRLRKEPGEQVVINPVNAVITALDYVRLDYLVAELFANDAEDDIVRFFGPDQPPVLREVVDHPAIYDAYGDRQVQAGDLLTLSAPTANLGPYRVSSGRAGVRFDGGVVLEPGQRTVFGGANEVQYGIEARGRTGFTAVASAFLGGQQIPVRSVVGTLAVTE
jgi:hypothetical protein